MLETKVMISDAELAAGLDKLLFTAKLIKVGDNPYITEDGATSFNALVDNYKQLEANHWIRQTYPYFQVLQAHINIQNHFKSQQIEEAVGELIYMYNGAYKLIEEGKKPSRKKSDMDKFEVALDKFRKFVQIGWIDPKYSVVLPKLEEAYAEVLKDFNQFQKYN